MKCIGKVFYEFDFDSVVMIVLEGDKLFGNDVYWFYDILFCNFLNDIKYVEYV